MIYTEKIPKILFIKGVFKKDCQTDDIFDKRVLEGSIDDIDDINPLIDESNLNCGQFTNYEKLPNIFNDIETWKKNTNLCCWNCTLQFTSTPVFIPKVIEPVTIKNKGDREKSNSKKFSISVHGVFCTFGCAKQYIETRNYSYSDRVEALNKIRLLHKLFYNTKMKEDIKYPLPIQLKQYGGDLTVSEFRENINKCSEGIFA
jgi:hypothetical protein